ncbi:hypothetical protein AB6A40_010543 [Gnathostoma spinigerum]|uniref:Uncharacterized protein n=1 Tax=Gnathostoma spinigerum TaxID=75299 RepID=A0ABD6EV41_9BILA
MNCPVMEYFIKYEFAGDYYKPSIDQHLLSHECGRGGTCGASRTQKIIELFEQYFMKIFWTEREEEEAKKAVMGLRPSNISKELSALTLLSSQPLRAAACLLHV